MQEKHENHPKSLAGFRIASYNTDNIITNIVRKGKLNFPTVINSFRKVIDERIVSVYNTY